MKILIVADEESRSLWDYFSPEKLKGIDMIISCGDLNANYLQFLVTFGNCPLLYVRGNHDTRYDKNPPDGCICIEDKIFNYKGMRIAGLGGSMKYKNSPNMFTEKEMRARWRRLRRKIKFTGGIDLFVTHAPAKGYGDMQDLPHRGFDCFNDLLMKYKPLYMLHGHVHKTYSADFVRERNHPSGTLIVNAYESCVLEIPDIAYPEYGKSGSYLYDTLCKLAIKLRIYDWNPI